HHRQRRHVVGAVHHHRRQPEPRLHPVVVGPVRGHRVGLANVRRHDWAVRGTSVPVHPLLADDLDLRDAHPAAGRARSRGGARREGEPPLHPDWGDARMTAPTLPPYGLVAEFATAAELVRASSSARSAGYKKMDAYSPFPIEG